MVSSARQTFCWNSVPAKSSGRSNVVRRPAKYAASCRPVSTRIGLRSSSATMLRRTRAGSSFSHRIAARPAADATSLSSPTGERMVLETWCFGRLRVVRIMSGLLFELSYNPPARPHTGGRGRAGADMGADFRQITVISQDIYREGGRALATPCRRVAACGVLHNPHTNGPAIDDVSALVELSFQAGEMDTMTVAIPDAPRPDEILLAVAFL